MSDNLKFPKINKAITDFLKEEEGSISRNKVLAVGSLMVIMSVLMAPDVYAAHRSNSSHRSHSSGSSHRSSHVSHSSHESHTSSSHSNHSNHASHSSTAAATKPTHTNTSGITAPVFKAPELYPLDSVDNQLLGTHTGTTASGNKVAVANLKVSDFKE